MSISGPILQAKAHSIAEVMYHKFAASNGWLEYFCKRHNIMFKSVSSESAEVSEETVENWKERLKYLCKDYKLEDIFNFDQTGLFFRATPRKSLMYKSDDTKEKKTEKEKLTIALYVNAIGEKLKLIVIG